MIDLNNIVSLVSYKEKKIQESVHARYTKKLIEGIKIVQELESLVREIENEHGSKIFKETWNILPPKEQKETDYSFNALIEKSKECKDKVVPPDYYSKKPSS